MTISVCNAGFSNKTSAINSLYKQLVRRAILKIMTLISDLEIANKVCFNLCIYIYYVCKKKWVFRIEISLSLF